MKQEQISDALNMLNDDILEETDRVRKSKAEQQKENKKRPGKKLWWKWMAAAVCFVIVLYAGIHFTSINVSENNRIDQEKTVDHTMKQEDSQGNVSETDPSGNGTSKTEVSDGSSTDLPILTIENRTEGMGYEGFMVYDISELTNGNPWTESARLDTLPVYRNLMWDHEFKNGVYQMSDAELDTMKAILLRAGAGLGIDTDELERTLSVNEWSYVVAGKNGAEIEVDTDMTTTIEFIPAVTLPDQYNFTYHSSSYKEMEAVAEYLKNEYKDLLGMKNPRTDIYDGDYTFDGEQSYNIAFYEGNGELADQIINYNFKRVTFSCNDKGELWIVRIFNPDLSDKVGDYPIITVDEAKELLKEGKYITSVPSEMPGMDYVRKVELVYRTGSLEEYFIPYYRFYVEVPELQAGKGLNTYGAYYVPAVAGEYISDLSVWDGSFN